MARVWREPYTQGLDGLCGVYAVINATQLLFPGALTVARAEDMFDALVKSLGGGLLAAVTDGLGIPEMRRLIDAADIFARKHLNGALTRREPYRRTKFARPAAFVAALERDAGGASVAVIGLGVPYEHWTVVEKITPKTLKLADSLEMKTVARGRLTLGTARGAQVRIDTGHTFILAREALP